MKVKEELNGYDLSRDWFDFCYENTELVNPNHTALYFFCIDHCNRLGWKEKFGLPMQVAMEAIGIKNYKTYSKAFTDLVEWGFISVIQKSKNQYSANIIALVKNTKASTKALSKASLWHSQKHSQKQVHGIVGIDKQDNKETIEPIKQLNNLSDEKIESEKNWKNDFDVYREELRNAYKEIQNDADWIKQQESFYQNVDILKSIEKACVNYWATPAGWKKKKQSKITEINWKSTFGNAISLNKVYKNGNSNLQSGTSFGNTENKQNTRRTSPDDKREKLRSFGDLAQTILQNS